MGSGVITWDGLGTYLPSYETWKTLCTVGSSGGSSKRYAISPTHWTIGYDSIYLGLSCPWCQILWCPWLGKLIGTLDLLPQTLRACTFNPYKSSIDLGRFYPFLDYSNLISSCLDQFWSNYQGDVNLLPTQWSPTLSAIQRLIRGHLHAGIEVVAVRKLDQR